MVLEFVKEQNIAIHAPLEWITDLAFGLKLRSWKFDKYHTTLTRQPQITFITPIPGETAARFESLNDLYQGVLLARELTVEPSNKLYPEIFAKRCLELQAYGVEVEVIDEFGLEKLGAQGILSVGKSSINPPRLVIMRWNGGEDDAPPIAFVGKGVCYDSGGINIKTKELVEMKFDKAGAAAVTGAIFTLARQKAPLNVVGVIGLAENMIDGASMRPGILLPLSLERLLRWSIQITKDD